MGDDHNHARAVRILDDQLGRLLVDLAAALDDEAWLAAEYFRTYAPRERRLQLVRLWLEWTAQHRGPRWTLPGVIVTRRGIDFTENADGTGARMGFVAEERGGTYWLVERGSGRSDAWTPI